MYQNLDFWFIFSYCLLMLVFLFFLFTCCVFFVISIFYCLPLSVWFFNVLHFSFFTFVFTSIFGLLRVLSLVYLNLFVTKYWERYPSQKNWGRYTNFVSFFFLWFWYEDTLIVVSFSSLMFRFSIFLLCRTAWTYCLMFLTTRFLEGSFSCVLKLGVVGYRLHH
jgi:hypothetical protein